MPTNLAFVLLIARHTAGFFIRGLLMRDQLLEMLKRREGLNLFPLPLLSRCADYRLQS